MLLGVAVPCCFFVFIFVSLLLFGCWSGGGGEPVAIAGVDPGLTRDGAFLASRTFGGV